MELHGQHEQLRLLLHPVAPHTEEDATALAEALTAAVAAGDSRRALDLTRRLERKLASRSRGDGASPRRKLTSDDAARHVGFRAAPTVLAVDPTPRAGGTARQVVTASLAEIGVSARARLVSEYAAARFGEHVEPRAFAAIRRDERRAWGSSSRRPTYIVPALEGRFFQPIRGLLALSDWPLDRRLIGPWSERTDHLVATAQLARQVAWLNERDPEIAKRLAPVVAGMARSVPGAMDGLEVDTARVEVAAESEREALAERDDPWRKEAAARAREQLSVEQQLWGTQIGVVSEGER